MHGHGDDWFTTTEGEALPSTLRERREVSLEVNAWYDHPGYITVHCKAAEGRYWAVDAQSNAIFRLDRINGGMDNWG